MVHALRFIDRSQRRVFAWLALAFIAFALAACGGEGGKLPGGTDGTDSTPPSVTLSIVAQATGNTTNTISVSALTSARALVKDSTGHAVANAVVLFSSSDSAAIAFSPATSALTDADGIASVTIAPASASTAGAYTIVATTIVGSTAVAGTASVAVAPAPSAGALTIAVIDGATSQPTTTLSFASAASVRSVVTDSTGASVRNAIVRFSASDAGAITFSPSSALTDASGVASVAVGPSTPGTAGAYTITASTTVDERTLSSSYNVAIGAATAPPVSVTVVDQATGLPTNTLSSTKLTSVRAIVRNASGSAVANSVVRFSASDASAIVFSPSVTALTDSAGSASVNVAPASFNTSGAFTITATTQVEQSQVTGTANVAVGAAQVTLGALQIPAPTLSAYGTMVVSVAVSGVPTTTQVAVRFTSSCASRTPARATITPLVLSSNGVASATYVDNGCAGADLISATVEGTSVSSSTSVTVGTPAIANLQFVGASPQSIAIRGTGGPGLSEVSLVKFRVIDQANNPVTTPTSVTLRLSNNTGGLTIDQGPGPVTRQTDANGEVTVQLQSGTLPTPVWVIASLSTGSGTLTTNSNLVTVTTAQPVQNRFSLSFSRLNIEGWQYDGEPTTAQIIAADIFGNPVPDGTTVNFVSETGLIASPCRTVGGVCSVTYLSQSDRPLAVAGVPRSDSGRLTLVAYAVGEEAFVDLNGNWRHDAGEPFTDLGDIYVDRNENGVRDSGEAIIPFLGSTGACVTSGGAPALDTPSVAQTCDGVRGLAHVRRQGVIVLSGSYAFFRTSWVDPAPGVPPASIGTSYSLGAACTAVVSFWLQDVNGNPMPEGSTITADVQSGRDLTVSVAGDKVLNTTARGGTFHQVIIGGFNAGSGLCTGSGTVVINVTTPRGNVTALPVTIGP